MARFAGGTASVSAQLNFDRIIQNIEQSIAPAMNQTMQDAYDIAQKKVPVRRVFKGGRRTFKTLPGLSKDLLKTGVIEGTPEWERFGTLKAAKQITGGYNPSRRIQTNRPWANRFFPLPGNLSQTGKRQRGLAIWTGRIQHGSRASYAQEMDLRAKVLQGDEAGQEARESFLSAQGRWELNHPMGTAKHPSAIYQHGRVGGEPPRLGGRLKGEIEVIEADYGQAPHFHGQVASPTSYAKYVEFGTRYAAAQPYLRPALMGVRNAYRKNLMRGLKRAGRFSGAVGSPDVAHAGGVTGLPDYLQSHYVGDTGDNEMVRSILRMREL